MPLKTSRAALEQAVALMRSEVLRLQRVTAVELPLAQKRLTRLERLLEKLTPITESLVDDILKEVVR